MSKTDDYGKEADIWNAEIGNSWIENQEVLDASMAGVLDLLLERAALKPKENVLDIGCGCGISCFEAAKQVWPNGHVLGADISAPMLAHAKKRARVADLDHVHFEECDAQTYEFKPQSFDVMISRFGVMFFEDPETAFRNISSALKPGGRMCFVAWASLEKNPWFALPRAVTLRMLGVSAPLDPNAPGPMAFADMARVQTMLKSAGLQCVEATEVTVDLTPPGDAHQFATFMTQFGSASRIIRDRNGTEEDQAKIIEELARHIAPYEGADGLIIPSALNVFQAQVG